MPTRILHLTLFALLTGLATAAGLNDARLSFSTQGPDRYADGTTVLDGECYALVWSKDDRFDGFAADGTCLDSEDRIVLTAPVARDGRCPPVLFQIPAETAAACDGGRFAVYLLDTRVTAEDGTVKPRGTQNGAAALVNGYGAATATVRTSGFAPRQNMAERIRDTPGQQATAVSAAPAACTQPKIKSLRVDGDNVYLTVENLKGYMRVHGGPDIRTPDTTGAATETSGTAEDVILVAPKNGTRGFYRVIRNTP